MFQTFQKNFYFSMLSTTFERACTSWKTRMRETFKNIVLIFLIFPSRKFRIPRGTSQFINEQCVYKYRINSIGINPEFKLSHLDTRYSKNIEARGLRFFILRDSKIINLPLNSGANEPMFLPRKLEFR